MNSRITKLSKVMTKSEKTAKLFTALFFVLLTLIGLWTVGDYTGSYDEIAEQQILASNMKEYAMLLRNAGITWEYWLQSDAVPISLSIERDHGISGYYLYGLLFPQIAHHEYLRYTLWSVVTWLWFMVGVWSLYAVARSLGMVRLLACAAALLLYLSPRFFADGHLNNKDVVLLCLMLAVLWQGTRFLDSPSLGRGIAFSMVGALATNTKFVAVLAWGLVMIALLVKWTFEKSWSRKQLLVVSGTAIVFVCFYMLLTPAMLQDPLAFFRYLLSNAVAFSRIEGRIFFRGASFQLQTNPLPFYYLAYMMLTTLPLYVFPLFVVGQLKVIRDAIGNPAHFFTHTPGLILACASGCWIAAMGAFVVLRPLVYNGWRHFYFTFAGVAILAGYGIQTVWNACAARRWLLRLCAAALGLCFVSTAVGMAVNHPRQSAYYNVLASKAAMETDYWNTSGTYALKRLITSTERNQDLPLEVGCYFFDIQNARFKLSEEHKQVLTTTVKKDSPYLYYVDNFVQAYDVPFPEGYHVLFEIKSYGRRIGVMYEKDTDEER